MTMQIKDVLVYQGRDLTPYLPEGGSTPFVPEQHGITPSQGMCSTACWRACRIVYEIASDRLYLTDFYVCLFDDSRGFEGPRLNKCWPKFAPDGEARFGHNFNNHYELRYPLDYTGSLLVGDGLSFWPLDRGSCGDVLYQEYVETFGSAWCYRDKILYRFELLEGEVVNREDLSELNQQYQQRIEVAEELRRQEYLKRNPPREPEEPPF